MFSKLVIVVLLAVTLGLYLKIVILDEPQVQAESIPQASVQVVEGAGTGAPPSTAAAKALPDDQMQLIKQVFAPELLNN
jgi:hypothetical protein